MEHGYIFADEFLRCVTVDSLSGLIAACDITLQVGCNYAVGQLIEDAYWWYRPITRHLG